MYIYRQVFTSRNYVFQFPQDSWVNKYICIINGVAEIRVSPWTTCNVRLCYLGRYLHPHNYVFKFTQDTWVDKYIYIIICVAVSLWTTCNVRLRYLGDDGGKLQGGRDGDVNDGVVCVFCQVPSWQDIGDVDKQLDLFHAGVVLEDLVVVFTATP